MSGTLASKWNHIIIKTEEQRLILFSCSKPFTVSSWFLQSTKIIEVGKTLLYVYSYTTVKNFWSQAKGLPSSWAANVLRKIKPWSSQTVYPHDRVLKGKHKRAAVPLLQITHSCWSGLHSCRINEATGPCGAQPYFIVISPPMIFHPEEWVSFLRQTVPQKKKTGETKYVYGPKDQSTAITDRNPRSALGYFGSPIKNRSLILRFSTGQGPESGPGV